MAAPALRNMPLPEPFLIGIGAGVALQAVWPWGLPGSRRLHRLLGFSLITSGTSVVIRSVAAARSIEVDDPQRLLTSGPFAVVRNPMYVGWALLHLGSALVAGSGWILAVLPPAALRVHREVRAEERALEARFGDEFRRYRSSVGRYLPRTFSHSI